MVKSSSLSRESASFRDPSGFIFWQNGVVYRQVNQQYATQYDQLMQSGLYAALTKKKLLVQHQESTLTPPEPATAYRVLEPEPIPFISYPYEWCFSQLKDAALLTLALQREALHHGMVLKDASAYNVQFIGNRPVFIDTLSFDHYTEGAPWIAYRQFCQHFLAPLALMAKVDLRFGTLSAQYLDGLPLDLASHLLPRRSRFNLGLTAHLHLHARSQVHHGDRPQPSGTYRVSAQGLRGLLDNLEQTVRGLTFPQQKTEWGTYYGHTNYSTTAAQEKAAAIQTWLRKVQPKTVLDVGANTGEFSRLAAEMGAYTIASDIDPVAVEYGYQQVAPQMPERLLPLIINFTNPSPAIGWANQERQAFLQRSQPDLVLCLALIHHLAISNNLPLAAIAETLAQLAPNLIIEFVPKADSNTQRLLVNREDIFPDYTKEGFEAAFRSSFSITATHAVADSQRLLYLLHRL